MPEGFPPVILPNKGGNQVPPVPPMHPNPRGPAMNQGAPLNRPPQGMPPQNIQPQNMPPQNPPAMQMGLQRFPHPPPQAVPQDLRLNNSPANMQLEGICDLRQERFSEAHAREKLSTYVMMRLEKVESSYDSDDEDYPTQPTWERVRRIQLRDISQAEAKRQVRALEANTKSVTEKKQSCSLAIQRQLERAQEELARLEQDSRYCYHLVQFDSKLRQIDSKEIQYYEKHSKREKGDKKDKRGKKDKKYVSSSSSKKSKKPKYERVSITAYFKRTPKPGQHALRMWEDKEKEKHMVVVPQMPGPFQQQGPNPQPFNQLPGGMFPRGDLQQQQLQMPIKIDNQGKGGGDKGEKGDKKREKGETDEKSSQKIIIINKEKRNKQPSSPSSSRRSFSDDIFDSEASDDSTSASSLDSGSRRSKHRRGRSRTRAPRDVPENYGVTERHRVHVKDDPAYIIDPAMTRFVNPPAVPLPYPQGYSAGERPFRRESFHTYDEEFSYKPRTAPLPRVFQTQTGVRHVNPPDAQREVLQDDLDRTENRIHRMRLNAAYRDEDPALDEARLDRLDEDLQHRKFLKDQLQDRQWRKTDAANYMDSRRRSRNTQVY